MSVLTAPAPTTRALLLGSHVVSPPVVLAPMAGITNAAYRQVCRSYGAGLYVSEMITARALVERDAETLHMVAFAPAEHADGSPRSIQLYGVDPGTVGRAVRMVVEDDLADHVDLNFGCPVPKVTRKGGGSALPYKRPLLRAILREAVAAADGRVPVTMKMRLGIDDAHSTYLDAGRIAQDEGCAWVALHARTAAQMYGGHADWASIARLTSTLDIPVLGNGDIWSAHDALRMMAETGCAGVVVGRGCLGRPWLFRDLAAAFGGASTPAPPGLREVADVMRRHAQLLVELYAGDKGVRDFRKHVAWYLKGFAVGSDLRSGLALARDLEELDRLLGELDLDQPYPVSVLDAPRGRTSGQRRVALPDGWLDDAEDGAVAEGADLSVSGG